MSADRVRPVVCLTVDLEPDCPPYMDTWRGMEEGAPRLLDLLAEAGVPATFFTTGEAARRHPGTIARLIADGHELACHGMTHAAFPDLDRAAATREVVDSLAILRRHAPITSFRAPYLRFPHRYLDILDAAGLTLDSSGARYKRADRDAEPPHGLVRVPASVTSSVLRLPGWLRDRWLLALGSPVVLFVHPWEFVDLTREKLRLDCRFQTGAPAVSHLRSAIALFAGRGARFLRMDALERDIRGRA